MKTFKTEVARGRAADASPWGVLLDLDQTLVLTSRIAHLRDSAAGRRPPGRWVKPPSPPGTRKFLNDAIHVGPIGVVTSSLRSYTEMILEHDAHEVPVVVAYHDVSRRKPHPDPVLRGAKELGFPPGRCVYVGDADSDILAAASAGAVPVGVTWEGHRPPREILARAHAWCESWGEVLDALSDLRSRGGAP